MKRWFMLFFVLLTVNTHTQEHLSYFHFVGRIMGLAVFHGHHLDGGFTLPFYKMLLNKAIVLDDITHVDPELHRSLTWMLYVKNSFIQLIFISFLLFCLVLLQWKWHNRSYWHDFLGRAQCLRCYPSPRLETWRPWFDRLRGEQAGIRAVWAPSLFVKSLKRQQQPWACISSQLFSFLIIVMWARPRPNGHKTTVPRSDRIWSFFFSGLAGCGLDDFQLRHVSQLLLSSLSKTLIIGFLTDGPHAIRLFF